MDLSSPLSRLAQAVVAALDRKDDVDTGRIITVNPVVSRVAAWYEKFRNSMEYREDEVILRATIERILKRRLLLGGNAKTTAEPLVRELIWGRYLPQNNTGENVIQQVEGIIDLYLRLRFAVLGQHKISENTLNEWTYHLMSSHLEQVLHPHLEEEITANFMFQLLKGSVEIEGEEEDTKNAQVYLAIRKAFARDDVAFLRFHMFGQIFGRLTEKNIEQIAKGFPKGFAEVNRQLNYTYKDRIFAYIKKRTATFLILEDIFRDKKGKLRELLSDDVALEKEVYKICQRRYDGTSSKIARAIIRSVIFIFLTKLMLAFLIEGTYDRFTYGEIQWNTLVINTGLPPLLMVIVGLFLRTPGRENTKRIYTTIQAVLHDLKPSFGQTLLIKKNTGKSDSSLNSTFALLWFAASLLSFGVIIYILYLLHFNAVSMFIFVFFLAIVSFLAYRISLTAALYRLGERQGFLTPIIDFFFIPIIGVGRKLTEGISQVNIFLFLFDFIIETPFKNLFAFSEQLFYFLHTKRDELG